MNIPSQYKWLTEIENLPKTISLALEQFGVAEVVGRGSNKTILAWRDALNLAGVKVEGYSDDDIAWCGLFVAIVCLLRMGVPAEVVKEPLWARNWSKYGIKTNKPSLGDVLVFERPGGGGHVAFYVAEDSSSYHVIGGNQGNKVSITRVLKSRLIAARRPPYKVIPESVKPYWVTPSGAISSNEA